MQLVGEELKNYKVLLALFCFVLYESIWEVWKRRGGGHVYSSRGNSRTLAVSDSPENGIVFRDND